MSWKTDICIEKGLQKLHEELIEVNGFHIIEEEIARNSCFRRLMDTKLEDLDPKFGYSFNRGDWEENTSLTFREFLLNLYGQLRSNFKTIVSKGSTSQLRGWVVYSVNEGNFLIRDIKMGSFYPTDTRENLEFLTELEKFFSELLKRYSLIEWRAAAVNEKVFKFYQRIIQKNKNRAFMKRDLDSGKSSTGDCYTFVILGDKFVGAAQFILRDLKNNPDQTLEEILTKLFT